MPAAVYIDFLSRHLRLRNPSGGCAGRRMIIFKKLCEIDDFLIADVIMPFFDINTDFALFGRHLDHVVPGRIDG